LKFVFKAYNQGQEIILEFVIGLFASSYVLCTLLVAAVEGLAWGVAISVAGGIMWWVITRAE